MAQHLEERIAGMPTTDTDYWRLYGQLENETGEPATRGPVQAMPEYQVGEVHTFWMGDEEEQRYWTIDAELRIKTDHTYLYVSEETSFDEEKLRQAADLFESQIYLTNHRYFGSEWTPGIDNDPRVTILVTDQMPVGIAGYFSSADEYPRTMKPHSNEREMIYLDISGTRPGSDAYNGLVAHELQHLVHWKGDPTEEVWVNEGLSEVARELAKRGPGFTPITITLSETQLNAWEPLGAGNTPHYATSHMFVRYLLEHYGGWEDARRLVEEPADGIEGIDAYLAPFGVTFEDVFADWLIANYLDDTELADGRYGYRDLAVGPADLDQTHADYPVQRSTTVHQYGADYIELWGQGDLTIAFAGSTEVKLVPNDPHSRKYLWWSNRGDNSNMTLTRAFDLTGLSQAALEAWLRYDIEEDWDYAYVEMSTDEGQTWDIVKGQHTTDSNPNGNSFGHAYTGKSQGAAGKAPDWVEEEIDLTPYVDQEILLRFEYITDGAVNHVGFCVDDIAIPELGYFYDTESDEQWMAEGFIRTDNTLPQRFLVQLIELGPDVRVQRMELDEAQTGHLAVEGLGKGVERAVLVVSGLAPVTTELAGYEYVIEPAQGN